MAENGVLQKQRKLIVCPRGLAMWESVRSTDESIPLLYEQGPTGLESCHVGVCAQHRRKHSLAIQTSCQSPFAGLSSLIKAGFKFENIVL